MCRRKDLTAETPGAGILPDVTQAAKRAKPALPANAVPNPAEPPSAGAPHIFQSAADNGAGAAAADAGGDAAGDSAMGEGKEEAVAEVAEAAPGGSQGEGGSVAQALAPEAAV